MLVAVTVTLILSGGGNSDDGQLPVSHVKDEAPKADDSKNEQEKEVKNAREWGEQTNRESKRLGQLPEKLNRRKNGQHDRPHDNRKALGQVENRLCVPGRPQRSKSGNFRHDETDDRERCRDRKIRRRRDAKGRQTDQIHA